MSRFSWRKKRGKKKRVKKGKNLNKCRTVCLNFIEYKGGGYPKLNLWINEKEKDYLETLFWDNIALYTRAMKMTKEERKNENDYDLFLKRLRKINGHFVENVR